MRISTRLRQHKNGDLILLIAMTIIFGTANLLSPKTGIWGLPLMLFAPGYTLQSFLFVWRRQLNLLERMSYSVGLSIVLSSILGLILGISSVGFNPILLTLIFMIFTLIFSIGALIRRALLGGRGVEFSLDTFSLKQFGRLPLLLLFLTVSSVVLLFISQQSANGARVENYTVLSILPEKLEGRVTISITNYESKPMTYSLQVSNRGNTLNEWDNIELNIGETIDILYTYDTTLIDLLNAALYTPEDLRRPYRTVWLSLDAIKKARQ